MKPYLLALVVGALVGSFYSLLGVRSPAPPVIALIGLLGMLLGEQLPVLVRAWLMQNPSTATNPSAADRPATPSRPTGSDRSVAKAHPEQHP